MAFARDSASAASTAVAAVKVAEERVARGLVAAHRARLAWLLRVPEWEPFFVQGVVALGLPGQRQGIRLEAALEALALEHKYQLVRWVAAHFNHHLSRGVAQKLCQVVGVDRFSELDLENTLSDRQWARLREAMLFRLAREHQRYKHAQQLLFINHQRLIERVVMQVVFDPSHRADCAQEGAIGLLQAIDRVLDEGDFAAYAQSWIRRSVRNHLVRQRLPVHAPVNLIVRATAAGAAGEYGPGEAAAARNKRDDTIDGEAGEGTAVSGPLESVILEMLRHPAVSLDRDAESTGDHPIAATLEDESAEDPAAAAARADLRQRVAEGLRELTEKQREVLRRRYGLDGVIPCSLSEIARRAGISHQQVSMRERRALQRLESTLAAVVAEYDVDW